MSGRSPFLCGGQLRLANVLACSASEKGCGRKIRCFTLRLWEELRCGGVGSDSTPQDKNLGSVSLDLPGQAQGATH